MLRIQLWYGVLSPFSITGVKCVYDFQTWDKLKVFFYVAYAILFIMFIILIVDPSHKQQGEKTSTEEIGPVDSETSLDTHIS